MAKKYAIPLVITYYWRTQACFVTIPVNDRAKKVWRHLDIYTERVFVATRYKIRNIPFPLWVSKKCNTILPPKLIKIKEDRKAHSKALQHTA
jgi:hypothetical protein